jgi:hypothetical protein
MAAAATATGAAVCRIMQSVQWLGSLSVVCTWATCTAAKRAIRSRHNSTTPRPERNWMRRPTPNCVRGSAKKLPLTSRIHKYRRGRRLWGFQKLGHGGWKEALRLQVPLVYTEGDEA